METEMEMMFKLKSHRVYWHFRAKNKPRGGNGHDVFGQRRIQSEQNNELCVI